MGCVLCVSSLGCHMLHIAVPCWYQCSDLTLWSRDTMTTNLQMTFSKAFFAWQHLAITWIHVVLSLVRSSDNHLRAISQQIPQPLSNKISLKITYLSMIFQSLGVNELRWSSNHGRTCNFFSWTLCVRGPSYLGLIRSISWLLMPWLLASPGHQQSWYWVK